MPIFMPSSLLALTTSPPLIKYLQTTPPKQGIRRIESDMECALTSSYRPVLVLVVGKSPALFERLGCGTDDSALFSMATMLKN
ncbi:hypothetical protein VNO77_46348 [Canavalia gladiata]|uniref:Uncharacterized protein n=1 Tax=Canavalia gladiata TaxID=3824 RepID=A0AAN9PIE9_CANGL